MKFLASNLVFGQFWYLTPSPDHFFYFSSSPHPKLFPLSFLHRQPTNTTRSHLWCNPTLLSLLSLSSPYLCILPSSLTLFIVFLRNIVWVVSSSSPVYPTFGNVSLLYMYIHIYTFFNWEVEKEWWIITSLFNNTNTGL